MASNAVNAQGTTLEISGTGGSAETITAMALGYPTILTSVAHALENGDVVTLANFAGDDAALLNSKVVVVKNVTTDTFAVEINTIGKVVNHNTGAATATPYSWIEIGEVLSGDGFDGEAATVDKTILKSTAKEKGMGLQDFGNLKLEVNIYDADTGQAALRAAKTAQSQKNFRVTYPNNKTRTFAGYVMSFPEKFGVDANITGSVGILIDGDVTYA